MPLVRAVRLCACLLASLLVACPPSPDPADTGPDSSTDTTCRSDRECSAQSLVCDRASGRCVECVTGGDCANDEACRGGACTEVVPCTSSRSCAGLLCDPARGYCVECIEAVDCGASLLCRDGDCVDPPRPCDSDRDCSDIALVCDDARGHCVECTADVDCPGDRYCASDGTCVPDACVPGTTVCVSDTEIALCLANGAGLSPASLCGPEGRCVSGACTTADAALPDASLVIDAALVTDTAVEIDAGSVTMPDAFLASPDAGTDAGRPMCRGAGGECDILAQDCGVGRACHVGAATYCAARGTGTDGSGCTLSVDCAAGWGCSEGICRRYCCGSDDSVCLADQRCIGIGDTGAGICRGRDACDLLAQTGCTAGNGCYVWGSESRRNCFEAGTLPAAAACTFINDCAPGLSCRDAADGRARCHQLCATGSPGSCRAGQSCDAIVVDGVSGVGACTPATAMSGHGIASPVISARVLVSDSSDLYPTTFTYELWVSFQSFASTRPGQFVITAISSSVSYALLYLRAFDGNVECVLGNGGGQAIASAPISTTMVAGRWHHLACTRDSAGALRLWVDGSLVGSASAGVYLPPTGSVLGLGGDYRTPPDPSLVFLGSIDEVRIADRVLYDAPFAPPARLTVVPGTRALWHFDEGAGSTTADSAAAGRHLGTLAGGATWTVGVD